jgi:hypothetical protein
MNQQVVSQARARAERGVKATVVLGAGVGAVGGLLTTAVALKSFEFGIFGAVAGALAGMLGALARFERPDV